MPGRETITVEVGELVEIRQTSADPGFVLRDLNNRDHFFYYTSDHRFAKYDGWAEAGEGSPGA